VVSSGVVMSFSWASNLVYAAYGEQAPQRRGAAGPMGAGGREMRQRGGPGARGEGGEGRAMEATAGASLDSLLSAADASVIRVSEPQGNARAQQSAGQRARAWFRLVHTGEQYGVIGQTVAGLASLVACFLVYTGLALAWRRLIVPLFRSAAPG
jgi:hypothetical protein